MVFYFSSFFRKGFSDADAYCKLVGLSGLAEAEIKADIVRMAGINACKSVVLPER